MDNKKSLLNVSVSVVFKLVLLVGNLLVRRYLIKFIGNDANGINSLYLSVIGVLSVVELGIGEAIAFCMYKPIVEGNEAKVKSLYVLFKRVYTVIGGIIALAGVCIMPFLPILAKGHDAVGINLYSTFALMLASVVLTYFFSAKTSLMNAYRDNYVTTTITSGGKLLQQVLQVIVLFLTKSFTWYLLCRCVAVCVQWIITDCVVDRRYRNVVRGAAEKVDGETKEEVVKNVKALFVHHIGNVLVNMIDSLIISAFIGVAVLGKYSNYTTIMTSMTGTLILFFSPLTSTIGHLFVQDKAEFQKYYRFFYGLNYALGCVFCLGYYAVIDDLILLLFGEGLALSKSVSFVLTLNYFIQFMRQATLLFRNASGMFYYDRWKPLFEGLSNLVLSIVFVLIFKRVAGEDFAVVGVLLATIMTNLLICHLIEPYVLHRHAFGISTKGHYLRNYACIAIFACLLFVVHLCSCSLGNQWLDLLANGGIAVGIACLPILGMLLFERDFRAFFAKLSRKVFKKGRNRQE